MQQHHNSRVRRRLISRRLDNIACGLIFASALPLTFGITGVTIAAQWHFQSGYVMPDADAIAVTLAMVIGAALLVSSSVVFFIS